MVDEVKRAGSQVTSPLPFGSRTLTPDKLIKNDYLALSFIPNHPQYTYVTKIPRSHP